MRTNVWFIQGVEIKKLKRTFHDNNNPFHENNTIKAHIINTVKAHKDFFVQMLSEQTDKVTYTFESLKRYRQDLREEKWKQTQVKSQCQP